MTATAEDIGTMKIMDENGDTEIKWSRRNQVEVDVARSAFEKMKNKGFAAYSMRGDGTRGEVIREFSPDAERIIFAPPMVGG